MEQLKLQGLSMIGARRGAPGGRVFNAIDPASGTLLDSMFHSATLDDVQQATSLAQAAAPVLAALDGASRGALLRAIADGMEAARSDFERLMPLETGLPSARANGELSRTVGQLRMFAQWVESGDWVDARIDHADPARTPLPKPDLRSMLRAIGPVAVFGASNFPLAFSVAGGDTASALAAGCPVVVKAHPAHPATSERAAQAICAAVAHCGLPEGSFSMLFDAGHEVGAALVRDSRIRAVAFTGSRQGGRALMDLAAARPDPIPVYAEMGSINPVFVLPAAVRSRGAAIAALLHGSVVQGVGQFCTNPGLLVIPTGADGDALVEQMVTAAASTPAAPMLSTAIAARYVQGVDALSSTASVRTLHRTSTAPGHAGPALLSVDAAEFLKNSHLQNEVFGPSSLIVRCADSAQMRAIAQSLEGQLSASLIADKDDMDAAAVLLDCLVDVAGRVLMNGVPTGVEPTHAMLHGGPWPASSEARSGSVGTAAIERFCRRICYQDLPDALLPAALRDGNPLGLLRLVDGQRIG